MPFAPPDPQPLCPEEARYAGRSLTPQGGIRDDGLEGER